MCRQATLSVEDLPDEVVVAAGDKTDSGGAGFFHAREQRISAFEREYLADLLRTSGGDVSQAARDARIPRGTFYRLLKKHDIDPAGFRSQGSGGA
jgi:two-component system response regulator GlrR